MDRLCTANRHVTVHMHCVDTRILLIVDIGYIISPLGPLPLNWHDMQH